MDIYREWSSGLDGRDDRGNTDNIRLVKRRGSVEVSLAMDLGNDIIAREKQRRRREGERERG